MRKNKLNLDKLAIQSFVPSVDQSIADTVKGGTRQTICVVTCIDIGPGQCGTGDTAPRPGYPCW